MEERFVQSWQDARKMAQELGVRMRPLTPTMEAAHRCLTGHRESDGFYALAELGRLDLSLEALAVKKQFTPLFSDGEANNALTRLLDAGFSF